uniref:Uncharacterized protein n=1 Tax=Oryza rufipogon TaxID=4529 RepID=A0A0E0P5J4_ORYRU
MWLREDEDGELRELTGNWKYSFLVDDQQMIKFMVDGKCNQLEIKWLTFAFDAAVHRLCEMRVWRRR